MQASSLVTCLWPGLPQLWWRGDWRALLVALGFAAALNLALVSSFLWPETLPPGVLAVGWVAIAVFWAMGCWHGHRSLPRLRGMTISAQREDLFLRAQQEYLKGHWYEAEALLGQLLDEHPGDVDAQLMRATLYRHLGRIDEGRNQLNALECMDGAEKWALEIARERALLDRLESNSMIGEGEPDVREIY